MGIKLLETLTENIVFYNIFDIVGIKVTLIFKNIDF